MVLLIAVAVVLSSLLFGDLASTGRAVRLALGSTGVALVICLPWLIGVLSAGSGVSNVFGVPTTRVGGGVVELAAPLRRRAPSEGRRWPGDSWWPRRRR